MIKVTTNEEEQEIIKKCINDDSYTIIIGYDEGWIEDNNQNIVCQLYDDLYHGHYSNFIIRLLNNMGCKNVEEQ